MIAATPSFLPPDAVPPVFWLVSVACFGAVLGSFLNCFIYRWPRRISIWKRSRSFCPRCKAQLRALDNIPILSWVFLAGKCGHCRQPISWVYPTVELLTASLFALTFYTFGMLNPEFSWPVRIIYLALVAALIAIAFVDCQVKRIPNEIVIPGIPLALFLSFCFPQLHVFQPGAFRVMSPAVGIPHRIDSVLAALQWGILSGGFLLAMDVLWRVVRRKQAFGFGDVKLMAMAGALIGHYAFLAIFVASTVGTILIVGFMALKEGVRWLLAKPGERKQFNLQLKVPFGPFLAIGLGVMLFWGPILTGLMQVLIDAPPPRVLDYICPFIDRATL
jgi:leader peptidase (prepilin peptidase)/N-methyltransferase